MLRTLQTMVGQYGHITILALCMSLAQEYVFNEETESPEEYGKMIGEIVHGLIETGKIKNPN